MHFQSAVLQEFLKNLDQKERSVVNLWHELEKKKIENELLRKEAEFQKKEQELILKNRVWVRNFNY
jgi:hypothetical protein